MPVTAHEMTDSRNGDGWQVSNLLEIISGLGESCCKEWCVAVDVRVDIRGSCAVASLYHWD